jgi:hypothetical protein
MRRWRIFLIAFVIVMAVGLGLSLNAYLHARAAANLRAAQATELQTELSQLQAAHDMTVNENRQAAETLERTASQLAEAQAAQQAVLADSLETVGALEETTQELESTSQELQTTSQELVELRVAHELTLQEYRDTVKSLQDTVAQLSAGGLQPGTGQPLVGVGVTPGASMETLCDSPFTQAVGPDQTAVCGRTTGPAAVDAETLECWATALVWKHLGRPRYAELTILRTYESTIANTWHVVGRFACIGAAPQPFAAAVKRLSNGDWRLLAFSWSPIEPGGEAPRAPRGGCCAPLPTSP